jgi:hypothetical protein
MTEAPKLSARKAAGRRNSRIWHQRQNEPLKWYATPASPVRVIEPGSPEWEEIAARYLGETPR